MTVQAQNALLKTIEEPPEYAIIILLTTNADTFLQTIFIALCYVKYQTCKGRYNKESINITVWCRGL